MFNKKIRIHGGLAPSFLKYILAAGGGLFLLIFLGTALSRLGYPYELEWMEGGAVDHVRRVIAGQHVCGN